MHNNHNKIQNRHISLIKAFIAAFHFSPPMLLVPTLPPTLLTLAPINLHTEASVQSCEGVQKGGGGEITGRGGEEKKHRGTGRGGEVGRFRRSLATTEGTGRVTELRKCAGKERRGLKHWFYHVWMRKIIRWEGKKLPGNREQRTQQGETTNDSLSLNSVWPELSGSRYTDLDSLN